MSRSHRHTSITGMTLAKSEKRAKQHAHRKERRIIRQCLTHDVTAEPLPQRRELINVYSFDKDGKQYFDARRQPKLMRK